MNFQKELIERVERKFPLPIAQAFRDLRRVEPEDLEDGLKRAIVLNEVFTKTIAILLVRAYQLGNGNNRAINACLRNFRTPTHGSWLELLRHSADFFQKERLSDGSTSSFSGAKGYFLLAKEISSAYSIDFSDKSSLLVFESIQVLCDQVKPLENVANSITPSIASGLGFLTEVRNKVFHGSGEIPLTPKQRELFVEVIRGIFSTVLERFNFLTRFLFCVINEVVLEKRDLFMHKSEKAIGTDFEPFRFLLEDDRIEPGLYLLSISEDTDTPIRLDWALPLSPYMIVAQCSTTHSQQVFFFNRISKKGAIDYLSYGSSGHFSPDSLSDDFQSIQDFLDGKISVAQLFQGKALRQNLPATQTLVAPEARRKSSRLVESARQNLEKGDTVLAQRDLFDAIQWDNDNAFAHYLCGVTHLMLKQDLPEAMKYLHQAIEIEPENPAFCLILAEVHYVMRQTSEAVTYARRCLRIDPSNPKARKIADSNTAEFSLDPQTD